ncbi:aminoglycoside phosphotransferase family protein [Dyadobacter sp. CY323]|uniref:aminoglycoside phosphotransferase family protein n=1 Tax=Dyadobacter sp. CY323 TaxID=2907302 RepID=UPI001F3F4D10|nr:aminoglycoside phosphotransferase family protein [Dyadobacter sp. CY323]MCE6990504.1 aminoglycoside phosphotransferase family protein [Dyadobacter sp. CY323]
MSNRIAIHYWKCDRPSAFYTLTNERLTDSDSLAIEKSLKHQLEKRFGIRSFSLRKAGGQGNHITYLAEYENDTYFLRLENGPEGDDYMEIEAKVLDLVRQAGVPTPKVYAVDATRSEVTFSYQMLEFSNYPDLNKIYKDGNLDLVRIAETIGENIAKWQSITPAGFGPFNPGLLRQYDELKGLHKTYPDYYFLNWNKHLNFLVEGGLLTETEAMDIEILVGRHRHYLELDQGCLVHKDLALWNILGNADEIKAFIDWDDTICGDPTDDLSLLACFHSGEVVAAAIQGYQKGRELPKHFLTRFWLHLIRNIIVKAVIRVGGGYFDRKSDFFLLGSGATGTSLRDFTKRRIELACEGLQNLKQIKDL